MLSIIGTPDENKTGLYFSRYEHVYLCNAIKGILIVDEYLQDYFILVDLISFIPVQNFTPLHKNLQCYVNSKIICGYLAQLTIRIFKHTFM